MQRVSPPLILFKFKSSDNGLVVGAASEAVHGVSDNVQPSGSSVSNNHQDDNNREVQLPPREKGAMTEHRETVQDKMDTEGVDPVVAPGVSTDTEQKQECDGSNEDPDVPPGFG